MRKKIRWAASVYNRRVEELRGIAEKILRYNLVEDVTLRWMRGKIQDLQVLESEEASKGGVYTGGSRIDRRTAAATITTAEYLGRYATVMDAEMLAIATGREPGDTAITGGKGGIKSFQTEQPRGWIEERVTAVARASGKKKIAWVKGHSGVMEIELADLKAKKEAWKGVRRGQRNIATAVQGNLVGKTGSRMGQRSVERTHLHLYR